MRHLATLTGVLLLVSCANLSLEQGKESFLKQDYRQAFIRLMPAAQAGNAEAQYAIGYMYYNGLGTIEDKKKALNWLHKAADQGSVNAIKSLNMIKKEKPSPYTPSSNPKLRPLDYD